jgi:hypothetical protein
MKKLVCLASIALMCSGFALAQSTSDTSQSNSATQNQQGASPTPPGDRRDRYGATIAPDGSVTPKGANTPGSGSNPQPGSMSTQGTQGQKPASPTPPGDRRDRYGDTIAPDGSVTPKGTNTPGAPTNGTPLDQPQGTAPNTK